MFISLKISDVSILRPLEAKEPSLHIPAILNKVSKHIYSLNMIRSFRTRKKLLT